MGMSAGGTLPMSSNRAWNGVLWLGGAFLTAATLRTGGGSSAKGHDDFDCGGAFAGNHGLAGQCAKPSSAALPASMRSGTQPRSSRQRRVTGEPVIAVAAPVGSARAPLAAADAYPAGEERVGHRFGMLRGRLCEAASCVDLSVSNRLPATGKAVSAAGWELPRRGARSLGAGACITSFRPNRVESADD